MPSDNICIKAPNLQPDHLAVVKYLSPAPDIILLNEKSQAGAGHPSVYRNSSPQPFPFASCANCIKAPLLWMGCQSWKPLSSPLGYTRNFTCSLLPKITHKLKPRVISWKANPAKGMPCLAINEGNQQQDDNMSRDRAFLCSQELHMHLAPCQCFRSLFSLILRDSGWDIYSWLSYLVVNHKTEAGGAKARGKEGEWTMKLSSSPGASYSTFPPILFSVTLPISINIRELYLLPCGTWTRAGLWQAHRSAGKWLQRRARSAAHSPGTWAQGFQVGRNPTLQPFSVHLSPLLLSKRLVTARGRIQSNFLHHPFWHSLCVTQKWQTPKILLIYWSNNNKESCV